MSSLRVLFSTARSTDVTASSCFDTSRVHAMHRFDDLVSNLPPLSFGTLLFRTAVWLNV